MYSASGVMAVMALDLVSCASDTNAELEKVCQNTGKLKKISQAYVAQHMGRWYQNGDHNPLCSFSSSIQAVNCAIDIQRYINNQLDCGIQIGIHTGELEIHAKKIEGQAKETAKSICKQSVFGGICISSSVFESIQEKENIRLEKIQNTDETLSYFEFSSIYQIVSDGLKIKERNQGVKLPWYYFLIILMLAFSISGLVTVQLFP